MNAPIPPATLPGPTRQIGFVVTDLDTALQSRLALGVGPWYVIGGQQQHASYRGTPCEVTLTIAFANSGDMQIEVIQQENDTPSIYTEFISTKGDLGDGMLILPGADIGDRAEDLDVLAELRVPRVNSVSLDPGPRTHLRPISPTRRTRRRTGHANHDRTRSRNDRFRPQHGRGGTMHVGRSDFQLLIDTMHLVRSRFGAADLTALEPETIGYAQLSDTTLQPRMDNYMQEATFERMVPRLAMAEGGVSHLDRVKPCVQAAQPLLAASR